MEQFFEGFKNNILKNIPPKASECGLCYPVYTHKPYLAHLKINYILIFVTLYALKKGLQNLFNVQRPWTNVEKIIRL